MIKKVKKNIKIIIPSKGEDLEALIDSRFGRCQYFILVEIKDNKIIKVEAIKNKGDNHGSGAGVAAVEQISKLEPNILFVENIGPKAEDVLNKLGIKIIKMSGTIEVAVNKYINT